MKQGAEFGGFSGAEINNFLYHFEEPAAADLVPAIAEWLNGSNFILLLDQSRNAFCDADPLAIQALERFARYSTAETIDPITPDEEFTHKAQTTEIEVSKFIQENHPKGPAGLELGVKLLSEQELSLMAEVFNPHNLLAFAKHMVETQGAGQDGINFDMVYRYSTAVKIIEARRQDLRHARYQEGRKSTEKVGARTWAGVLRPYGDPTGKIDKSDYQDFNEDVEEDFVSYNGDPVKRVHGERMG